MKNCTNSTQNISLSRERRPLDAGLGFVKKFCRIAPLFLLFVFASMTKGYATVNVAISTPSTVSAGSACAPSTRTVIYRFTLTGSGSGSSAHFTDLSFTQAGTATSGDITQYQLWSGSVGGTLVASSSSASFTGFSTSYSSFTSNNYYITADIPSGATATHTIIVSPLTTSNITLTGGTTSTTGTIATGGTQTISAGVTISGTASVCVGSTTTLTGSPSGGTWSSSSTSKATVGSTGIVTGVSGTGTSPTITYTSGSCSASVVVTVSSTTTPSVFVFATPTGAICAGTSVTFTPFATGGGTPTYEWFKNGSSVSTASSYTSSSLSNGDLVYTIMTSTAACVTTTSVASATITMTVNPTVTPATPTLTTPGSTCNSVTLNWGSTGASTYEVTISTSPSMTSPIYGPNLVGNVTTFTRSTGISPSTTYYYQIRSDNTCGGFSGYSATGSVTTNPTPSVSGPSSVCVGSNITLTGTPVGGAWSSVTPGVATIDPSSGIVGGVSPGTSTIHYLQGGCTANFTETATNIMPSSFAVTPSSATICSGASQKLNAPDEPGSNTTTTFGSTGSFTVPDNSSTGVTNVITVSGIPSGATIVDMSVELNSVTMANDRDLTFNIKAPNGSILNLVDREGSFSGSANFTNTIISSASSTNFTTAPFTGTFGADESSFTGPTGLQSNVTTWPPLYTTMNGSWTLAVRDQNSGSVATVNSWSIIIHYTTPTGAYTWSPTTGLYNDAGLTSAYTGSAADSVYASPVGTTTYIAAKSETGLTCTSNSSSTITVGGNPALTGMPASQNLCFNAATAQTVPFTYTGIDNGATQYTLTWSPGGTLADVASLTAIPGSPSGTINATVPAGAAPGTYTGTLSVLNASGCTGTSTISIVVYGLPALTGATASQNLCFNASSAQTASFAYTGITNGGDQYSLTWTPGSVLSDVTTFTTLPGTAGIINVAVPAGAPANTYTGTLTVNNSAAGCVSTSTITTVINGLPALTGMPSSQNVCFNTTSAQTASFPYTGVTNGANQYTLTWSPGSILTDVSTFTAIPGSTSGTINVSVPAGTGAGTYTGTLTVKNAITGCTNTSAITIVVSGVPSLTGLTTSQKVCFNASFPQTALYPYTGIVNGANQYTLTWSPGSILADVSSFTTLPGSPAGTISVNVPAGAAAGTYTGTVTAKNSSTGCTTQSTITLFVSGLPALTGLPGSNNLCFDAASIQTAPFPYTGIANGGDQYLLTWSPGSVLSDVTSFTAIPAGAITVDVPAGAPANVYTGTLVVKNSTIGCATTSTIITIVNDLPALTSLAVNQSLCFSGSAAQTASFGYASIVGGADQYKLTWSAGSGLTDVPAFTALPGSAINVNVPAGTPVGTYTGTLTVQNSATTGCPTTYTVTILVNSAAAITGLTTNQAFCFDAASAQTGSFTYAGSAGGADQYTLSWAPSGTLSDVTSFTTLPGGTISVNIPAGTTPDTYTGTLTVQNSATGCTSTSNITNVVNGLPVLNGLTNSQTLCFNASAAQTASFAYTAATNGANEYTLTWSPGSILPDVASFTALTEGAISVNVPAGAAANTYTGTLTVKNSATGCNTTTTVTMTINPLPSVTGLTTGQVFCYSAASAQTASFAYTGITNSADQYTLTWSPGGVLADVSAFTVLPGGSINVNVPAGTPVNNYNGTLTVNNSLTGCTSNSGVSITVNPLPFAGTITGTAAVCPTFITTLSDAATGGLWSSTATGIATVSSTGDVAGVATGTTTISYTVTNSCGTIAATQTVTVNPLPVIASITGVTQMCQAFTTTLSDATTGGVWSSNDLSTATVDATGIVYGVAGGTPTISYTVTNGCGNTSVTTVVTVNATPSAITGGTGVCEGSTLALNSLTTGGTWNSSNTSLATVDMSTGVVTGIIAAGASTISYTSTEGCITTADVTVNAMPSPIAGATVCGGAITTLSDIPTGGTWTSSDPGTAFVSAGGPGIGIVTGVSGGTPTITYTLATGCYTTASILVNPVAGILGTTNVCFGNLITLVDPAFGGGTWSSSDLTTATVDASGNVTGVTSGTAIISYTLPTGCITATPVVFQAVPSAITGSTDICAGTVTTLSNTTPGGSWSSSDATLATVITSGLGTAMVAGISAGTPVISYTIGTGCTATAVINVNPLPAPADPIAGTLTVCQSSAAILTDGTPGGVWSSSNTAVASADPSGVIVGLAGGTTTISYTLTNSCGSTAVTSPITVNALPSTPSPIGGAATVCNGSIVTYSDPMPGGSWTSSDGTIATITATGIATGVALGTATISYTNTNSCGSASVTKTVTVNPLPVAGTIIGGSATICAASVTTLTDVATSGIWSSSNPAVATVSSTGDVTGAGGGLANISYTVTNGCGSVYATAVITVNTLPAAPAAISGPSNVCPGSGALLHDVTTGGAWSSSDASVATITAAGLVTGVVSGSTTISYTKTNSCGSVAASTVFTVNPLPVADSITGIPTVCTGSVTLLNDSPTGGIWLSDNNAVANVTPLGIVTGIAPGTATISYVASNSCGSSSAATIVVTVNPAVPAAGPITGGDRVCMGDTVGLRNVVSGGIWSSNDNTIATVTPSGVVTGVNEGVANITYSFTNTCGSVNSTLPVDVLSINLCNEKANMAISNTTELKAYPNPSNGTFNILLTSNVDEPMHITITNVVGQKVSELTSATNKPVEVRINKGAGMYMVSVATDHGNYVTKITVE